MNRRDMVLAVIALGAAPLTSFPQQAGKVWRIGFLAQRHIDFLDSDNYYGPFTQGMRELGYVDGKNLKIEWRSGEGRAERLPALATELVNLKVDAIVTIATLATLAAQKATSTIPIVMANVGDPVTSGLVKSLAQPGGNTTGHSNIVSLLFAKHLEMLITLVPKLTRVAVLVNPSNHAWMKRIPDEVQRSSVKVLIVEAQTPQEIEKAFFVMARERPGAILVTQEPFLTQQQHQIAELALKNRLPSIYGNRQYAAAGGLLSYGANLADGSRRAATYVDKILKGAKPGDLPVEQPTRFELIINGKTAKALGLTIPQSLLVSADRVIE
jgi:putative ABC transport system substrate-binding protein